MKPKRLFDMRKFRRCAAPCQTGTPWQRLLDFLAPRYSVGVDPAYNGDAETTVLFQRLRNGCIKAVKVYQR